MTVTRGRADWFEAVALLVMLAEAGVPRVERQFVATRALQVRARWSDAWTEPRLGGRA